MPGRSYNSNSYRFNFQGQENAVNSNWQQFELRMHNSDLGRWMSPDPYGQFASPYISMGNNPINGTDPNGGYWANLGKSSQSTTQSGTSGFSSMSPSADGINYGGWIDSGFDNLWDMYLALGFGGGGFAGYSPGGGGGLGSLGDDDEENGWFDPNWANNLTTQYIVTDKDGGEHISFTKAGADKLKDQYDFYYDQMFRSDGKDMGSMFWADAQNLTTDANTYYIGKGLSVKDLSKISVELGGNSYFAQKRFSFEQAYPQLTSVESPAKWVDPANQWNGGLGVLAGAVENLSGSRTIGTNLKVYSSGWRGNQYVSTMKVAKIGKIAGYGTLLLGTAMDGYGVLNYYRNGSNDPNSVHPGKAGLNLGIGLWSLLGPATAVGTLQYILPGWF